MNRCVTVRLPTQGVTQCVYTCSKNKTILDSKPLSVTNHDIVLDCQPDCVVVVVVTYCALTIVISRGNKSMLCTNTVESLLQSTTCCIVTIYHLLYCVHFLQLPYNTTQLSLNAIACLYKLPVPMKIPIAQLYSSFYPSNNLRILRF